MGTLDSSLSPLSPQVNKVSIHGNAFGGQQPVSGATVVLYAVGNSGYGSAATPLAVSQTNKYGAFSFSGAACSTHAPLYVLAMSGNPGNTPSSNDSGVNPFIELGAGGFTCDAIPATVQVNEVSTIALTYALSHYYAKLSSPITYGALQCTFVADGTSNSCSSSTLVTTSDTFGGPNGNGNGTGAPYTSAYAPYSMGLYNADAYTIPVMVNVGSGGTQAQSSVTNGVTIQLDSYKINTLADVVASCVNSDPGGSLNAGNCYALSSETNNANNTLQAMIYTALNPDTNQSTLFKLVGSNPVFAPTLSTAPSDWAIGVSYSSSNFGLTVPTGNVSTIDIDASGNVWFPSNGVNSSNASLAGVGYFAPKTGTFSKLLNSATKPLVTPTQIVIDGGGTVWANDTASPNLVGFSTGGAVYSDSVNSNYTTTALTASENGGILYAGLTSTTTAPAYEYGSVAGSSLGAFYASSNPLGSMASSSIPSLGTVGYSNGSFTAAYVTLNGGQNPSVYTGQDYTGQVVFTGTGFVALRAYDGHDSPDAICSFNSTNCYPFSYTTTNNSGSTQSSVTSGTFGLSLDGLGTLWTTESSSAALLGTPLSSVPTSSSATVNPVNSNQILFGFSHGSLGANPFGIATDNSGNVWMSNASGTTGSFTLTEMIGLGAPTVTPVVAQVYPTNAPLAGTEPSY